LPEPKKSRLKDARAVRSRQALRAALLTLIEQKSFDQISIRDITAAASVSYPVFFRQYSSKEDLLGEIAIDEIKSLLAISIMDFHSSLAICQLVQGHRLLWKTLLTAGAASIMRAEFIRLAREISETRERMNPWLPVDLTSSVVVGAMFEILAWWLAQPEDYPIEHIARIIEVLAIEPALQPKPFNMPG
jgi:AcrR family transcriptional regulator